MTLSFLLTPFDTLSTTLDDDDGNCMIVVGDSSDHEDSMLPLPPDRFLDGFGPGPRRGPRVPLVGLLLIEEEDVRVEALDSLRLCFETAEGFGASEFQFEKALLGVRSGLGVSGKSSQSQSANGEGLGSHPFASGRFWVCMGGTGGEKNVSSSLAVVDSLSKVSHSTFFRSGFPRPSTVPSPSALPIVASIVLIESPNGASPAPCGVSQWNPFRFPSVLLSEIGVDCCSIVGRSCRPPMRTVEFEVSVFRRLPPSSSSDWDQGSWKSMPSNSQERFGSGVVPGADPVGEKGLDHSAGKMSVVSAPPQSTKEFHSEDLEEEDLDRDLMEGDFDMDLKEEDLDRDKVLEEEDLHKDKALEEEDLDKDFNSEGRGIAIASGAPYSTPSSSGNNTGAGIVTAVLDLTTLTDEVFLSAGLGHVVRAGGGGGGGGGRTNEAFSNPTAGVDGRPWDRKGSTPNASS